MECCIGFIKGKGFDLYENLDSLFIFSPVDVIVCNVQCSKKLFGQIVKTLIFFTLVLKDKIVCPSVFKQRYGNGILSFKMLCKKKRGEGVFYAFKLGIEGTVVELNAFNNRGTLKVVVICFKLKIKNFDTRPFVLIYRFVVDHEVGSKFLHLIFDLCMKLTVIDIVKHIGNFVGDDLELCLFHTAAGKGRRSDTDT